MWVLNLILLAFWGWRKSWYALIPILILAGGFKYFLRTYQLDWSESKAKKDFSVVSYNVRVFNSYAHLADKGYASSKKMIKWLKENPADVLCLQEFIVYESMPMFRTVDIIKTKHPYVHVNYFYEANNDVKIGMAIFSKFPIINKGAIRFRERTNNNVIYADLKIGNDTVRVYNMHLQSMSIDEQELAGQDFDSTYRSRLVKVMLKYRRGAIMRSKQVQRLLDHMNSCPYRIVLCGDLNETPYTYSYEKFRDRMDNAYEEEGNGFGFTYNGALFFLRIDNIFTDKELEVLRYKVHRDITWTDHFPVSTDLKMK